MSQVVNPGRVAEILKFVDDKELFVTELLAAINRSVAEKNPQIIENCLEEWEASAELNSIPGFAANVKRRYKLLVKAGLINAE
jgi:3-methyladenine DNA glycosylase AlkC